MITFFVFFAVLFRSFFFLREIFQFQNDEKKVQLFFGTIICLRKVTLRVTLSKRSKLPVSKYFLIYVVVHFILGLKYISLCFVDRHGNVDNEF